MFTFKSGISKERMPDIESTGVGPETFIVTAEGTAQTG